jgi:hypothetical protein
LGAPKTSDFPECVSALALKRVDPSRRANHMVSIRAGDYGRRGHCITFRIPGMPKFRKS